MAEEEQTADVVVLQDNFYRDSFGKVVFAFVCVLIAIGLLVALSIYIHLLKPKPIAFAVDEEFRVQRAVPLEKPYLNTADVAQWTSDSLQKAFVLDFLNYNSQLQQSNQYFTADGWKTFLNQLNIYVNYNNVQSNKLFVNSTPAGTPFVLNQGCCLSGKYGWWVQLPLTLNFAAYNQGYKQTLTLQILVVRVSTLNNLNGIAIDNIIVSNSGKKQVG